FSGASIITHTINHDPSEEFNMRPIPHLRLISYGLLFAGQFALAAATGVAAAQEINPGLWEIHTQMSSPDGSNPLMAQLQERFKDMPPAAREMMEQQLAAMGVGLGAGTVTLRNCVSPEQAKAGPIHEDQLDGDCKYTKVQRKGDTWQG